MKNASRRFVVVAAVLSLTVGCGLGEEYVEALPQAETDGQSVDGTGVPDDLSGLVAGAVSVTSTAGSYDRRRAAEYVDRYALQSNPSFPVCGSVLRGTEADCTNFASQALWYAGLPRDRRGSAWSGWWSNGRGCDDPNSSRSWRRVNDLIYYLVVESRRGEIVRDVSKLQVGDLIFYGLREPTVDRDGRVSYVCPSGEMLNHTTVVSAFDENRRPLVSYHTRDALHVPYLAVHPDSSVRTGLGNACQIVLVHIKDR